jgi:hypothetical protein
MGNNTTTYGTPTLSTSKVLDSAAAMTAPAAIAASMMSTPSTSTRSNNPNAPNTSTLNTSQMYDPLSVNSIAESDVANNFLPTPLATLYNSNNEYKIYQNQQTTGYSMPETVPNTAATSAKGATGATGGMMAEGTSITSRDIGKLILQVIAVIVFLIIFYAVMHLIDPSDGADNFVNHKAARVGV